MYKQLEPSRGAAFTESGAENVKELLSRVERDPNILLQEGMEALVAGEVSSRGGQYGRDFGLVRSLLFSFHHCLLVRSSTRGFRLL